MNELTFQQRSVELCQEHGYWRVGGYDPQTGLAWACLKKDGPMFHIEVATGLEAYGRTYTEVTKFQEGIACALTNNWGSPGRWIHIFPDGWPVYPFFYLSVGLYFESLAEANNGSGRFHIDTKGKQAYDARFKTVGYFCGGLAQASDESGCFHINREGQPIYDWRGLRNGPFNTYGFAWAEIKKEKDGVKRNVIITIDRDGNTVSEK